MMSVARRAPVKPVTLPYRVAVCAIGDIHGCADLLSQLLEQVRDAAPKHLQLKLVFLGDYVDRGPESRLVIDMLTWLQERRPEQCYCLKGNHEEALMHFLEEPMSGPKWCDYGGAETLMSYGVAPPRSARDENAWFDARDAFQAAMPKSHLRFFRSLLNSVEIGDYFFAHAGARPGVPLADQSTRDLLWIRDTFLSDQTAFEKVVVHGHTPAEAPYADERRIGVDTGAYATGVLTAVMLEPTGRRFLQALRSTGQGARSGATDAA